MSELKELPERQRMRYADAWRAKLLQPDPAQRTLGLHDVMHEVHELCQRYTEESVDSVLSKIYSVPLTRRRLRRLSRIPRTKLEAAMKKFERTMARKASHRGASQVLTTTHLEALGRCVDRQLQLTLLNECAAKGWNASQLRKEVASRQSASPVRPLKLARQIRVKSDALIETVKNFNPAAFAAAVDKVKLEHRESFQNELDKAIASLRWLRDNADLCLPTLASAKEKVGGDS